MLFGANTMTFYDRPILEAIEVIARCGFDCVEIWVDHAWDEQKGAKSEVMGATIAQYGLETTVHCPIMDINITSPNKGIRAESLRQTFRAIDLARDLESRLIVMHPGHMFSSREPFAIHWVYQVDSIQKILSYAQEQGVMVALENMDSNKDTVSVKDWADLQRLFADCRSMEKLVTLDTTHLRETEQVLSFIAQARSNIVHLHLSDGTINQMHLPLGEGNLNLSAIAQALGKIGYTGVCSLECFIPNDEYMLQQELFKARDLFK
jgi:sugar phosphate isomerase/epimerase